MKCPFCGFEDSKVMDSRPTEEQSAIRRRRECESCAKRFTTYEKIEEVPFFIIKKNGSRELYQRKKIINGLLKAFEKRAFSIQEIEKIADEIEKELFNLMEKEIESKRIGETIMNKLRQIDDVAYVRYVSVYRQFQDLHSFMDELNKIMKTKIGE